MVHALGGLRKAQGIKLDHLVSIMFGGSLLTPDVLQMCLDELGAKCAEPVYGMTEGVVIRTWPQRDIPSLVDGDDVTCGWVLPGSGLRIVDPDTNQIVPRNTLGELRGFSPFLSSYIGDTANDCIYNDDDGRLWLKTGDQARMDDRDRIFITGRYKDMCVTPRLAAYYGLASYYEASDLYPRHTECHGHGYR